MGASNDCLTPSLCVGSSWNDYPGTVAPTSPNTSSTTCTTAAEYINSNSPSTASSTSSNTSDTTGEFATTTTTPTSKQPVSSRFRKFSSNSYPINNRNHSWCIFKCVFVGS